MWALGITVSLSIIALVFWALLYSSSLANLSFVIPIRNFYQEAYWKIGGFVLSNQKNYPPLAPIYTIQPQKALQPGMYTYTFIGTFSKLDIKNTTIYLKSANQKTYTFNINSSLLEDDDLWLKIYKTTSVYLLGSNLKFSSSRQVLVNGGVIAAQPTTVGIRWNDTRTLVQIEKAYNENSQIPLNQEFPRDSVLAEFK